MDTVYVDGEESLVDNRWYKQPLEKMYDGWGTMSTSVADPAERIYIEVARCVLEDIE